MAAVERWAHPGTVLLLHDCHPTDEAMAARERTTVAWAGDVWKVVACLRADRPDLTVTTVDVGPTGVGVITGLGAGFDDLDGSIERYRDLDYAVLETDPHALLHLVPPDVGRRPPPPGRITPRRPSGGGSTFLAMDAVPDGFTLREATPDDHEAIVAINTEVFDGHEGAAVRQLLERDGYGPGEWTVVTDDDGRIVSACTLFEHRLRFGSVELPAAQIEFVATRPEARKHGLVRAQFAHHHARAAELGALAIVITGIPYLYRRLGYGYAFVDGRVHRVHEVPDAPEGWTVETPPWTTSRPSPPSTTEPRRRATSPCATAPNAGAGWSRAPRRGRNGSASPGGTARSAA